MTLAVDTEYFSDRTKLQTTGRRTGLYKLEDALIREAPVLDLTDKVHNVLFPRIPKEKVFASGNRLNNIKWIHSVVVGPPSCGKTELFKYRAMLGSQIYGRENFHIIYTDNVLIAIDSLDNKKVQYIIIDDSSKEASSTNMMKKEAQDAAGYFFRLRHEWENRTGTTAGILIIEFGFQRWMTLRPDYRSGIVQTFKAPLYDVNDEKLLKDQIGEDMHNVLCEIGEEIFINDNDEAKSDSVVLIPALRYKGTGLGYYHSELVDFPDFPEKMLTLENYTFKDPTLDPNHEKTEKEQEKARDVEEKARAVEIFRELHHQFEPQTNSERRNASYFDAFELQGMTIEEIAVMNGVSEQTVVKGVKAHCKRLKFFMEKGY